MSKQTTWAWCPYCRTELTRVGDVLEDGFPVIYKCPGCGALTHWDFDAPVPLHLDAYDKREDLP